MPFIQCEVAVFALPQGVAWFIVWRSDKYK